jgi:hypothetical protein
MKSTPKQFDQLIKEKLNSLEFTSQASDQELLKQKLHAAKSKANKQTGIKLLLVIGICASFALMQRYFKKGNLQYFKVQEISSALPNLASEAAAFQPKREVGSESQATNMPELIAHFQQEPNSTPALFEKLQHLPKFPHGKISLNGLDEIQAPAIDQLVKYEGKFLQEAQTSKQKTLICGQSEDGSKLIVAQSKVAKFKADSTLSNNDDFGVYRPSGLQEDAVIQYAVFDKKTLFKRFQFEQIHHGIRTTKIAKPQKAEKVKTEKNKEADALHTSNTTPNLHVHPTRQYLETEYEEYTYYIQNDSILFISDRVNYVVIMTPDGDILSKAQIVISEPYMYYLGEKTAFFDQATGKVYLSVSTLYHINIYELDPNNGQTNFLISLDDVWPDPNFSVVNGVLHYRKDNKAFQQQLRP